MDSVFLELIEGLKKDKVLKWLVGGWLTLVSGTIITLLCI